MNPRVFVVSGPSGVGKSTIIKKAAEAVPELVLSVSHTTREPREGEEEGRDYHFIARAEFERMIGAGDFLEWAEVFGNYYGTSRNHVEARLEAGHHVMLDVDTQGAMNIKTTCSGVFFFFIKPPSLAQLEVRLRNRGSETDASLFKRLSQAEREIGFAGEYDQVIVNDDAERSAAEMVETLREEEQRAEPFFCSPAAETGFANVLGDDDFLTHLRSVLRERIRRNFSAQVRVALRAELHDLIDARLEAVLERELERLLPQAETSAGGAE